MLANTACVRVTLLAPKRLLLLISSIETLLKPMVSTTSCLPFAFCQLGSGAGGGGQGGGRGASGAGGGRRGRKRATTSFLPFASSGLGQVGGGWRGASGAGGGRRGGTTEGTAQTAEAGF